MAADFFRMKAVSIAFDSDVSIMLFSSICAASDPLPIRYSRMRFA